MGSLTPTTTKLSSKECEVSPDASGNVAYGDAESVSARHVDPALSFKMGLVNDAIDQIGFTPYHLKLFFLNGFGYAADSLLAFLPSIAATNVAAEFNPAYRRAGQLSLYIGLLFGALFWGITADIIGRKWAFNTSLLMSAVFTIVAGAAPNYESWTFFNAMLAFGAGGNLVLDTTVFLEYLPHGKTWLITLMAAWWGVGQTLAGLFAWAFLPNFSCASAATGCSRSENQGWRYLYYTAGGVVFVMSILRVTIIRFHETPKFSLCQNDDEMVIKTLGSIAEKYNRPFTLTVHQLQQCGEVSTSHAKSRTSISELTIHYRGLFSTRAQGLSTALLWLSWCLIGLAYPLFYIFLPDYFASRGADFGDMSAYLTWRDYAITNTLAIPGPVIAGYMCKTKLFGRKYTMAFGGVLSMAFLLAYTTARNAAANLGFSCVISIVINIYYGTLYAYTPEALPSAHRATGNGTAVACNRFFGIISVVIATFADTSTSVPIYLCAALFGGLAVISVIFPFEPARNHSL
ncbi:MFS general substrate transporter [Ophiobolus disseminans]|uniref:MFS general substrate transporter n=1 Tax=Ophiobolus disseminans TaxID=1469910 RepID=A0A6A6ZGN5_9PLEO|nr:MFS general substrate transporter [Ophiobolus disseminans]